MDLLDKVFNTKNVILALTYLSYLESRVFKFYSREDILVFDEVSIQYKKKIALILIGIKEN